MTRTASRRRLSLLALWYLQWRGWLGRPTRFDVVAVDWDGGGAGYRNFGACEDEFYAPCEGDASGSSCTQFNENSQCPDGPDSPGCQAYSDAYFHGDDENMTDQEKMDWAENKIEDMTGMNFNATMTGSHNVNVACYKIADLREEGRRAPIVRERAGAGAT